uniref:Rhoa gtpase effector dia/diaphanous n=1 Tax=Rhipicephalus zambeziensis TaxID=60191 RepID=A0A224Z7W4_9ACAR
MQSPHGDGLATKITPSKATQLQAAPRGPTSPGPFHTLPKPQQKMKTLNWTKVPDTLVCGGKSIWSDVTKEAQEEHVERKLNFKQVEELFCQKTATTAQPKVPPDKKKKREPALLSLLDGKRSLNVCIFLKQFKSGPEQIVEMIRSCKSKEIGAERLRMLQKILPEPDELSMLRSYTGDRSKLGQAEQFFLMLGDLRLYALYVDGMLQMEEFRPSVDALKPQLDNYIGVCQEILTNRSLKEFLKLILITGNFINSGSYAGNAFGFRLNTLPKLLETRSNKPRMTLLHFLVEIAEKEQAQTLSFTKDLRHLAQCSRLSLDGMRAELKQLSTGIEKLERHLPQGDADFKRHFGAFITAAKAQLSELSSSFEQIGQLSRRLAEHFCEEESRFSVEECLHIFNNFCEKVKLAQKENEERRQLEERAEKLKITRMGTDQSKPGHAKKPAASFVEEECIVDRLLAEIRQGSFKLRKTPA